MQAYCLPQTGFPWVILLPLVGLVGTLNLLVIVVYITYTSSFARSATSPSFAYVSNPVPDSYLSVQSCCSLIASASAAVPRVIASIRFNCHAAKLPACIRFSCCSPLAFASAAALDCQLHCFPIASALATAPQLHPLQLCSPMASASSAAPRLQLLLPDCVRFGCCSPPAVQEDSSQPCPLFSKILRRIRGSKYEGRASL